MKSKESYGQANNLSCWFFLSLFLWTLSSITSTYPGNYCHSPDSSHYGCWLGHPKIWTLKLKALNLLFSMGYSPLNEHRTPEVTLL